MVNRGQLRLATLVLLLSTCRAFLGAGTASAETSHSAYPPAGQLVVVGANTRRPVVGVVLGRGPINKDSPPRLLAATIHADRLIAITSNGHPADPPFHSINSVAAPQLVGAFKGLRSLIQDERLDFPEGAIAPQAGLDALRQTAATFLLLDLKNRGNLWGSIAIWNAPRGATPVVAIRRIRSGRKRGGERTAPYLVAPLAGTDNSSDTSNIRFAVEDQGDLENLGVLAPDKLRIVRPDDLEFQYTPTSQSKGKRRHLKLSKTDQQTLSLSLGRLIGVD